MEESKVREIVKKNLEYLMHKHNIKTQLELAKTLQITEAQLSNVLQMKRTPALFPFFASVKEHFGCSLDEFLFTDMEAAESEKQVTYNVSEENYRKIYGLYQLYYFNTATFKGREYADDADALRCGLLMVCRKNFQTEQYRVLGIFDLRKEETDELYPVIEKEFKGYSYDNVRECLNRLQHNYHIYEGTIELSKDHMYLLMQYSVKDKVLMILHNHLGRTQHYRGGLATMVSVSKGRQASPCMQYLGVSRYSLKSSKEEIAEHLLIHYPPLRTYDAVEELTDMVIDLYGDSEKQKERFSMESKKLMVRSNLDKIINETIEKNLFRSASVTSEDDDEWYHYLKRVNNIP